MHSDNRIHKNIRITGKVQGVGFRYHAMHAASNIGVTGFVRNLSEGAVYIEAEGSLSSVEAFIAWCRQGPPRARVDHLDITEGMVAGYQKFLVK